MTLDLRPTPMMTMPSHQLTEKERLQWQAAIAEANRHNIFCHCKLCDREWVTSVNPGGCECGSREIETIACWQFPDG